MGFFLNSVDYKYTVFPMHYGQIIFKLCIMFFLNSVLCYKLIVCLFAFYYVKMFFLNYVLSYKLISSSISVLFFLFTKHIYSYV